MPRAVMGFQAHYCGLMVDTDDNAEIWQGIEKANNHHSLSSNARGKSDPPSPIFGCCKRIFGAEHPSHARKSQVTRSSGQKKVDG